MPRAELRVIRETAGVAGACPQPVTGPSAASRAFACRSRIRVEGSLRPARRSRQTADVQLGEQSVADTMPWRAPDETGTLPWRAPDEAGTLPRRADEATAIGARWRLPRAAFAGRGSVGTLPYPMPETPGRLAFARWGCHGPAAWSCVEAPARRAGKTPARDAPPIDLMRVLRQAKASAGLETAP